MNGTDCCDFENYKNWIIRMDEIFKDILHLNINRSYLLHSIIWIQLLFQNYFENIVLGYRTYGN